MAFLNFLTASETLTAFRMTHKPLLLFKTDIETFVVALALGSDSAWILVSILTSLRNLNSGWPFRFAFFPPLKLGLFSIVPFDHYECKLCAEKTAQNMKVA